MKRTSLSFATAIALLAAGCATGPAKPPKGSHKFAASQTISASYDPSVSGLPGSVGDIVTVAGGATAWVKSGTGVTDWQAFPGSASGGGFGEDTTIPKADSGGNSRNIFRSLAAYINNTPGSTTSSWLVQCLLADVQTSCLQLTAGQLGAPAGAAATPGVYGFGFTTTGLHWFNSSGAALGFDVQGVQEAGMFPNLLLLYSANSSLKFGTSQTEGIARSGTKLTFSAGGTPQISINGTGIGFGAVTTPIAPPVIVDMDEADNEITALTNLGLVTNASGLGWKAAQSAAMRAQDSTLTECAFMRLGLYALGAGTGTLNGSDAQREGGAISAASTAASPTAFTNTIFQAPLTGHWAIAFRAKFGTNTSGRTNQIGITNAAYTDFITITDTFSVNATFLDLQITKGAGNTIVTSSFTADTAWHTMELRGDATTIRMYVDGSVVASTATLTNIIDEPMQFYLLNSIVKDANVSRVMWCYVAP